MKNIENTIGRNCSLARPYTNERGFLIQNLRKLVFLLIALVALELVFWGKVTSISKKPRPKERTHFLPTVTSPPHNCAPDTRRVTKRLFGSTARWCEKKIANRWVKHGEIRYFDLAGRLKLRGYYLSGKQELRWTGLDDQGKVVSRSFYKQGRLHGKVEKFHENGSRASLSSFHNGILNGPQTLWFSNGQIAESSKTVSGKLHGPVRMWFQNGKLRARHDYLNAKGDVYTTLWWESGVKEGEGLRLADGSPSLWRKWHPNGQLRFEGYMSQDMANGVGATWRENGSKEYEGDFFDGSPSNYVKWDENGYKEKEEIAKKGELIRELFYKLGRKVLEIEFQQSKKGSKVLTLWNERGQFGIRWTCTGGNLTTIPMLVDDERRNMTLENITLGVSAFEFINFVCKTGHYSLVRKFIRNPLGSISAELMIFPGFMMNIRVSRGRVGTLGDVACLESE